MSTKLIIGRFAVVHTGKMEYKVVDMKRDDLCMAIARNLIIAVDLCKDFYNMDKNPHHYAGEYIDGGTYNLAEEKLGYTPGEE